MMKPCRHLSPLKPSEFQPMRLEQLFVVTRDPPSGTTKEIERHRTTFAPRQPTWHVTTFAELLNAAHCHWSCGGRLENKKLQEMAVIGFHIKKKTKGSENLRYLFFLFFWLLHLRISRFVSRTLNQLLRLLTVWGCLQNINDESTEMIQIQIKRF